ncbi:hypothetical protein J7L49_03335 [Candidatus Bathyarchaeota archaeon]|nr:hypothetical protein [Candidatus Bathyarchaeota archaeon]
MKGENEGQIRIIEAFLASLIIFSSLIVSANLTVTQNQPENNYLESNGLQALIKLDSDGTLGRYIDERNWTAIRDSLNLVLPAGTSFNLTIYNEKGQLIGVVSNGGLNSENLVSIEYFCASQSSIFHCYILHLKLTVAAS